MGVVYEAEQPNPRRTVALKLVRAGAASAHHLRRFENEAHILGKLEHPGIATIFEAGTLNMPEGTRPYFAMELIKGEPLNRYADSHNLITRQRLELIARIADALQHAHQKGIIHRDLKPSNILVTDSGQPKILDFGVARATDGDIQTTTMQTDIGQLIGTVPYMSPEQVAGDPTELDTRSDVYALGVVAYELLAGRLPYDLQNKMVHEAVRVIREDDPTPLSSVSKALRGDLEIIVSTALEKDKLRRYQSAGEMARDIERYLNTEPILARPHSVWYRAQKLVRRHALRFTLAGFAAVASIAFVGMVAMAQAARSNELTLMLRESQAYAAQGDLPSALARLDQLIARDPTQSEAVVLRATLWLRSKEPQLEARAGQEMRRLLDEKPDAMEARYILTQLLLKERPQEALRLKQDIERQAPNSAASYFLRSLIVGDPDEALRLLSRGLDLEPSHVDSLYRRAWLHHLRGRRYRHSELTRDVAASCFRDMRLDAERVVGARPKEWTSYLVRGVALAELGEDDAAASDFTRAISLSPDHASLYFNRASVAFRKRDYVAALADYRICLKLSPQHRKALEVSGVCMRLLGDPAGACTAFERSLQLAGDADYYVTFYYYLCLLDTGRASAGIATLQSLAAYKAAEDKHEQAWSRSILLFLQGQLPMEALIKLAEGDPGRLCEAYYFIGESAIHADSFGAAIEYFKKCVDTGQDDYNEFRFAEGRLSTSPFGLASLTGSDSEGSDTQDQE